MLHDNSYIDVFSNCKMVKHDDIVAYITSEQEDKRREGFKALDNVELTGSRKDFIRQAFECHISDDRLLEYRDSCEAVVDLVKKTSEYGFYSEFREYLRKLRDMSANIPTRKAHIVFSAVRDTL